MPIIKIFVVTKDEYDLIEDWTHFYGKIFDYSNLYIIDTGSENPVVLDFYKYARTIGVNIIIDPGYTANSQGQKFTKYMLEVKSQANSDFLLGCDTDNFLVLPNKRKIVKEDYFNYFDELPKDRNKFCIHSSIDSVVNIDYKYINNKYLRPVHDTNTFYKSGTVSINFYRTNSFISTTNGNHSGITNPDQETFMTKFQMYHYHYTGLDRIFERALVICNGYQYFSIYMGDQIYEHCKQNHLTVCNFISNENTHAGIHRVVQAFAYTLRRFVYTLFLKYSSAEFFTLNNFYLTLYATENPCSRFNKETSVSSIMNECFCKGPHSYAKIITKIQEKIHAYPPSKLENDFEQFFKNKINNIDAQLPSTLTFFDILRNDEQIFSDYCRKIHHAYDDPETPVKKFLIE